VEQLLHERRTSFVVVTTLEEAPLREATFFCDALSERRFHLGALVLNRTLPGSLCDDANRDAASKILDEADSIASDLADSGAPDLADQARTARVLRAAAQTFRDYSVVAAREADLRKELGHVPDIVATVPALEDDVHDLAGLRRIGAELFSRS
jgi:anion-transporting  ArsA/GET3 family ATPase